MSSSGNENEAIAVVIEKLTEFIEGMDRDSALPRSPVSTATSHQKPEPKPTQVLLSFPIRLGDVSVHSPEELVSALRRWNDKVELSPPAAENVSECEKCGCSHCPRQQAASHHCKQRMTSCTTYRCRGCGFSTACRNAMLRHLAAVHRNNGTKYDAESSVGIDQTSSTKDLHFANADSLPYEDCNESDEIRNAMYVCEQCDYTTGDLHSLIAHFRSHDEPKPSPLSYRCRLCGYTCRQQRTIKAHIWKHSGHQDIVYPMFRNGPLSIYEECSDIHAQDDDSVSPVDLSTHPVDWLKETGSTEMSIVNMTGERRKIVLRNAGHCTEKNTRNSCVAGGDASSNMGAKLAHNNNIVVLSTGKPSHDTINITHGTKEYLSSCCKSKVSDTFVVGNDKRNDLCNKLIVCAEGDDENRGKTCSVNSSASVELCVHSALAIGDTSSAVTSNSKAFDVRNPEVPIHQYPKVLSADSAGSISHPNSHVSVNSSAHTLVSNCAEVAATSDVLVSDTQNLVFDVSNNDVDAMSTSEDVDAKTTSQSEIVCSTFNAKSAKVLDLQTKQQPQPVTITGLQSQIAATECNSSSGPVKAELASNEVNSSIRVTSPGTAVEEYHSLGGVKREAEFSLDGVGKRTRVADVESLARKTDADSGTVIANASRALEMATATLLAFSPRKSLKVGRSAQKEGGICRSLLAVIEQLCGEKAESDDDSSASFLRSNADSSEPSYACRLCSEVFAHRRELREHVRVHCEEAYRQVSASRATDSTPAAGRELTCPQCDFVATSVRSLKSHGKRHANARRAVLRPLEVHACELCAYVCHHRASLKSHMWRHAADADYSYERTTRNIDAAGSVCDERESSPVRDEVEPERYTCHLCGYACRHAAALKSHMWRHASDENYSYHQTQTRPRATSPELIASAPECVGEVTVSTTDDQLP